MADDFEDGTWYVTDADTSGGKNNADNDGWGGTIFASTPANAVANQGFPNNTGYTATSGFRSGANWEGWHWFSPAEAQYNEIYHRFYTKFVDPYTFGHEKLVFYQTDETTVGQVCVLMTPFGSNDLDFTLIVPDIRAGQNQGNNIGLIVGHWYYIEVRVKLDTPKGNSTGIIQMWADDCGLDGLTDPGAGTLRTSHTGLNIRPSDAISLGVIWQENWSNASDMTAVGEVYNDQVIVSKSRIGPMGFDAGGGGALSDKPPSARRMIGLVPLR